MRSFNITKTIPANTRILVFSCPWEQLHNIELKAVGSLYVGGSTVDTSSGLPLTAGSSRGYTFRDFRQGKYNIDIYAVADVETSLNIFGWLV